MIGDEFLYLASRCYVICMSSKFDSYQKRRLRTSYFVILSISLVLFMVGILGLVLLKSRVVANHLKEIALTFS